MAIQLLPDELIVHIISFLPAKSLLRFRLVCKSWLNLINSTKFKLMHLHNFNQLNPRYLVHRLDYSASKEWFCVYLDDEAFTFDHNLQFPFKICNDDKFCYRIIVCCNGVVCLYDNDGFGSNRVILWNPSIRRKLTLTLPKSYDSIKSFDVLGLGYDKMSHDYKLVRLFYIDYGYTRSHVEVYTVKTGIWREVMFPADLRYLHVAYNNRRQVFYNGSVHWIASDHTPTPGVSHKNSIMTFDTSTELFGEILLPDDLLEVPTSTMMVSIVGKSFAVTYYNGLRDSSTYKIWVLKEHNNPTSWTLICNMHYPEINMGKPLKLRNGDMIMESMDENIIVYNYRGYVSGICPGYESEGICRTYVDRYEESLALLDVGHSVSNDEGFDDD